jgi:HK97 family phage portal protein
MGAITRTFRQIRNAERLGPVLIPSWQSGRAALPDNSYRSYATEGYQKNELVYAAIEERATSAAEPRMKARVRGEWTLDHPILTLLNKPNPFMDRFEFWATVIMHTDLAGNAYGLIVRSASRKPVQLWLLRPDRVSVVPDAERYISHYLYDLGDGAPIRLPVEDVLHFKTRHPFNDFYGMPRLMAASGRVDIDNYMRDFVKTYFEKAGVPAGMLNIEGPADKDFKKELKDRFNSEYGGPGGWHGLMVIDSKKASFTPMTASLGASGLVVPDLDKISVRRILMVFGVPGALIGADDAPTSYAALEMVQRFFWDNTLAPLYREMVGPLNLRLTVNFPGVEEVAFDLSDVRALQEDVDELHARERADLIAGGITKEEFRERTGRKRDTDGTFYVPSNLVPMTAGRMAELAESGPPEKTAAPTVDKPEMVPA